MGIKNNIQVKTDDNGDCYLDLNDFKDIVDISKVDKYSLEEIEDDGKTSLLLCFYDKDDNKLEIKNG